MSESKTIRLTKLEEVENPRHPLNIPPGFVKTGAIIKPPAVGERFCVGSLSTSPVQEILSPDTFRTLNSIYKWEVIKDTETK